MIRFRKRYPRGVKAGWWNLGDGPWEPKGRFLTRMAKRGYQVIYLLEAGDRLRDLHAWAVEHGFHLVIGNGEGGQSTPALVRRGPEFKGAEWRTFTERQHIGDAGAGPATAKAKGSLMVRFDWLRLYGIHTLPSVQQSNLPNTPKRRSLWKRLTRGVARWMTTVARPGAAGGDYNLEHPHPLFGPFRRFVQHVLRGDTHDSNRRIDLLFTWFCTAVDVENLDAPSDHNFIGATILRRRRWRTWKPAR